MKINKIFLALAVFGFLFVAASALAATGDYVPLVKIPGVDTGNFLNYLRDMYNFLISIVGILAMASLVYGGFRYLTSVGNPAAVEDAKDIINSAIIGLVLALSSWLILNEINPDILVLKKPGQIGALPGKYAYKEIDRACVADPNLEGVPIPNSQDRTCKCVDDPDKNVIAGGPTKITLTSPVSGASAAVGTLINLTGKLTDASGSPVSGKEIRVYVINDKVGIDGIKYTHTTTNATGDFSISSLLPTQCDDNVKLQAVFPAINPYSTSTFIASDVVNFTATGAPACAMADYPLHPAKTFVSGKPTCQDVCSTPDWASDGKYHCLKADLRLGTLPDPPSGSKNITAKKNQKIYFDASSGSVDYAWPGLKTDVPNSDPSFENGIAAYLIKDKGFGAPDTWNNNPTHESNIFQYWSGANFGQYVGTACSILGPVGEILAGFYGVTAGEGYTSFSSAGDYKIVLNVRSKNGCLGPAVDMGFVTVSE